MFENPTPEKHAIMNSAARAAQMGAPPPCSGCSLAIEGAEQVASAAPAAQAPEACPGGTWTWMYGWRASYGTRPRDTRDPVLLRYRDRKTEKKFEKKEPRTVR